MAYTLIADPGIAPRDPALPWAQNAPGLYQVSRSGAPCPEAVVELGTGERVAVSVEEDCGDSEGDGNSDGGACLRGYARWIAADGSSETTPDGKVVESEFCCRVSQAQILAHKIDTYRREVLAILLGDPRTMLAIAPPLDARAMTAAEQQAALEALRAEGASPDATFVSDPDAAEVPLIAAGTEQLAAAEIGNAIAVARQMRVTADPAALLG